MVEWQEMAESGRSLETNERQVDAISGHSNRAMKSSDSNITLVVPPRYGALIKVVLNLPLRDSRYRQLLCMLIVHNQRILWIPLR
jgi:hypothetical protein